MLLQVLQSEKRDRIECNSQSKEARKIMEKKNKNKNRNFALACMRGRQDSGKNEKILFSQLT